MVRIKATLAQLKRRIANRFVAFGWSLASLPERVAATRDDMIMNARAATKRFPIRGLRYWWILCALIEEVETREEGVVVADAGCNRGHIKRFAGDVPRTQWVGLDLNIDDTALRECGYSELHQCDFDKPLPLAEQSVDIVVFSHVIEHLPRPDFTLAELSRILRPGGLLIAGSPVAPFLIAQLRERQLRRRLEKGRIQHGKHINSMAPSRWKRILHACGMNVEKITGTFFARWSGNPLENQAWWARLNQLWGALFPAWGGEIYLTARKPLFAAPHTQMTTPSTGNIFDQAPQKAWAAAALLLVIGAWPTYTWLMSEWCPVRGLVARYQDGNDRFYLLTHSALQDVRPHANIEILQNPREMELRHAEDEAKGKDAHFLVSRDLLATVNESASRMELRVIEEIEIDKHRFVLLSSEESGRRVPHPQSGGLPRQPGGQKLAESRRPFS